MLWEKFMSISTKQLRWYSHSYDISIAIIVTKVIRFIIISIWIGGRFTRHQSICDSKGHRGCFCCFGRPCSSKVLNIIHNTPEAYIRIPYHCSCPYIFVRRLTSSKVIIFILHCHHQPLFSSHLISSYLILSNRILSYLILFHLISCRMSHVISS